MEASHFENTLSNFCFVLANVLFLGGTDNVFDGIFLHVNDYNPVDSWPGESDEMLIDAKSLW